MIGADEQILVVLGRSSPRIRSSDARKALAGGLVSHGLRPGDCGVFARSGRAGHPLRETGAVFAILIGWLFLGKALTLRGGRRLHVVALGAFCLGYQP